MKEWSSLVFVKILAISGLLRESGAVNQSPSAENRSESSPSRRAARLPASTSGLLIWVVVLLATAPACKPEPRDSRPAPSQLDRPNILLLMAEDMSPRVGAFGDRVAKTSRLDALASEGTRFPNTFTTAGVCAPSRAAQITGVHQNTLGAGHMRTSSHPAGGYAAVPPPWIKGYPELLRAAGYYTFNDGKTDYQLSASLLADESPRTIWDESKTFGSTHWQEAPSDRPFFGLINFGVTHESGLFPRLAWPENTAHAFIMLANLVRGSRSEQVTAPDDVELPPYYPDTALARETVARQYDNIHLMDQQVGEVLDQLRRDGLEDSTVVIWTTDHGSGLPAAKRELTDAGIRVPMIIRWPERFRPPGMLPGEVQERMVSFVDIAPTILAMAGVPVPEWMVGQIFAGDQVAAPREFVFAARDRLDEFPDRARAVRSANFKYIRNWYPDDPAGVDLEFRRIIPFMKQWRELYLQGELNDVQGRYFEPRPVEELYDLRSDPWETRNLIDEEASAGTRARLRAALDDWLAAQQDLGALPESELRERFQPGGVSPITPPPVVAFAEADDGWVAALSHQDPHISMGIRRFMGSEPGPWELYTEPIAVETGATITAYAVRYGWLESPQVERVAGPLTP